MMAIVGGHLRSAITTTTSSGIMGMRPRKNVSSSASIPVETLIASLSIWVRIPMKA